MIQSLDKYFNNERQILHLLPYYLDMSQKRTFSDIHILTDDQRVEWWNKFAKATGKNFTGLPEPLRINKLQEITSQPLLNYLLAFSYSGNETSQEFDDNLNKIYHNLIESVYKRVWSESDTILNPRKLILKIFFGYGLG